MKFSSFSVYGYLQNLNYFIWHKSSNILNKFTTNFCIVGNSFIAIKQMRVEHINTNF